MPEYDLTISIIGKDSASGVFGQIDKSLRNITETALGVALGHMFISLGEDLVYLAGQAINATAQIQLMQVSLQALAARELVKTSNGVYNLATAYEAARPVAEKTMDELARISILSPYTVAAVQNTFRLNTAFGFTFKQATLLTEGLLNMAAGVGADNEQLKRMSYNLSQIRLQGKVTAMDIRQLALAGLDLRDVLQYIAKQEGYNIKSHLEFNKLIASGKISWEEFAKDFNDYATKYFGKASENMARTLLGLKSTFSDVFILTLPQIVGRSVSQVTFILNGLLNLFLKLRDLKVFERLGRQFSAWTGKFLGPMTKFIEYLNEYLGLWDEFNRLKLNPDLTSDFNDLLIKFGGAPTIINAVRYALEKAFGPEIAKKFDTIVAGLKELGKGNWLKGLKTLGLPQSVIDFFVHLQTALINLKLFWDTNGEKITSIFTDIAVSLLGLFGFNYTEKAADFGNLTNSLVTNGPLIVNALDKFRDFVVNKFVPDTKEFWRKLTDVWIPKIVEFGGKIEDKWKSIAPIVLTIATAFFILKAALALFDLFGGITGIVSAFAILVVIGPTLIGILTTVAANIVPIIIAVGAIALILGTIANLVIWAAVFIKYWDPMTAKLQEFSAAVPALQEPIQGLVDIFEALSGYLAASVQFMSLLGIMMQGWVKDAIDGFTGSITGADGATKGFWGTLVSWALMLGAWFRPKMDEFVTWFLKVVGGAFEKIAAKIQEMTDKVDALNTKLKNMVIPWWLEGHSPSPLELSFAGINKQLESLNKLLPDKAIDGGLPSRSQIAQNVNPNNTTNYFAPVTLQTTGEQSYYELLSEWRG